MFSWPTLCLRRTSIDPSSGIRWRGSIQTFQDKNLSKQRRPADAGLSATGVSEIGRKEGKVRLWMCSAPENLRQIQGLPKNMPVSQS